MQAVRDQGERAEHGAADDLRDHHHRAEDDHRPGPPLGPVVIAAQEKVVVLRNLENRVAFHHGFAHFR